MKSQWYEPQGKPWTQNRGKPRGINPARLVLRRGIKILFILWVMIFSQITYALDPVAPLSERKQGSLSVKTPLPETDVCEVIGSNSLQPFQQKFKSGELIKLPVGNYIVKVALQDTEWERGITIEPTERTDIVVTGYGNLKVVTPHPSKDVVEVYTAEGKMLRSFHPTRTKTLPTGTYNIKVKMGEAEVTQRDVMIVSNTTREISTSLLAD